MPGAPGNLLTACSQVRRPQGWRIGAPPCCSTRAGQQSTMLWPACMAPCCCPRPQGLATLGSNALQSLEAAWQACGQSQHTLLQQVPNKTVLAGPAGCGKTTVLKVLADSLGFELCTWEAPTPVLWQEHLHQVCCLHIRQRWQVRSSTCEQCSSRQISEHTVTHN